MIEQSDIAVLDNRYVLRDECHKTVTKQGEELNVVRNNLTVLSTKLNVIIGILGAIGVAVVSAVVKILFE